MDARRRAARVVADIQRSRAQAAMNKKRGYFFAALGVRVKDGEVRSSSLGVGWKHSRPLGPLAGASAGVMDVKQPGGGAIAWSVVIGDAPRIGTLFVAVADGTIHTEPLRQRSRAQMQAIDDEIALFNAMADIATEGA